MILPMRLVWSRFSDGFYDFGGEFVSLSADEADHLERFIAAISANRAPLTVRIA